VAQGATVLASKGLSKMQTQENCHCLAELMSLKL